MFAREFKRLRKRLGLTQMQVAKRMSSASRQTIGSWESGRTTPKRESWLDIEEALELKAGWVGRILSGVEPKYEPFDCEGSEGRAIEKPCVTKLCTNHHMDDITAWINTQDEPEMHWAELKSHLRRLEPDFAGFLKKRTSKNIPDTTNQSTGTG